jgi:hypothetical protein
VAVTPQITLNVSEELVGKLGKRMPVGDCKLAIVVLPEAGQDAPPVGKLQLTAVQDKPAAIGSRNAAPSADPGPALVTTMV